MNDWLKHLMFWPAASPPTPTASSAAASSNCYPTVFIEYTPYPSNALGLPGCTAAPFPPKVRAGPPVPVPGFAKKTIEWRGPYKRQEAPTGARVGSGKVNLRPQFGDVQTNVADPPSAIPESTFGLLPHSHAVVTDTELSVPLGLSWTAFQNVSGGTGLQCRHQTRLATEHREHQQLGIGPLMREPAQQRLAMPIRQPEVHQEHIGATRQGVLARIHAARVAHQAPRWTRHQRPLDKLHDGGIVFDQVDARGTVRGGQLARLRQN